MKLTTHKGFSVLKEFQWEVPHIVQKVSAIMAELHTQNTSLFASARGPHSRPTDQCVAEPARPTALEQAQESIAKVESWRSQK